MRSLPRSATKTEPAGSTPTPVGPFSPGSRPGATVHCPAKASLARREQLDPVAVGVGGEQPAGRVDRQALRRRQLSRAAAGDADRAQEVAVGVEHLDAVVGGVGDVGVAGRVAGERAREGELAGFRAEAAPGPEERQLRAELDDAVVDVVGHVHVAGASSATP